MNKNLNIDSIDTGWRPDFKCACGFEQASEQAKTYTVCPACGRSSTTTASRSAKGIHEEVEAMDWPEVIDG